MTPEQWEQIEADGYFRRDEFLCRCGCGRGPAEMNFDFVYRLNEARKRARVPFHVTGPYRCPEHNANTPGASPTSSHPKGVASDLTAFNSAEFYSMVLALFAQGFERIIFYPTWRVHVDDDADKASPVAKVKAA